MNMKKASNMHLNDQVNGKTGMIVSEERPYSKIKDMGAVILTFCGSILNNINPYEKRQKD